VVARARTYDHRYWGREQRASTDKAPAIASADSRAIEPETNVSLAPSKKRMFRVRDSNPGLERERLIS
jgi:hypothetical protein